MIIFKVVSELKIYTGNTTSSITRLVNPHYGLLLEKERMIIYRKL